MYLSNSPETPEILFVFFCYGSNFVQAFLRPYKPFCVFGSPTQVPIQIWYKCYRLLSKLVVEFSNIKSCRSDDLKIDRLITYKT